MLVKLVNFQKDHGFITEVTYSDILELFVNVRNFPTNGYTVNPCNDMPEKRLPTFTGLHGPQWDGQAIVYQVINNQQAAA
jgi:hypothetical protein